MKAKLIKVDNGWVLMVDNIIYATDENGKELVYQKLSLKNCQAIERGYDLDELAEKSISQWNNDVVSWEEPSLIINHEGDFKHGFREGFQICLELMGNKKFTEEDMARMMKRTTEWILERDLGAEKMLDDFIQSLQQTEWDVEVEMGHKRLNSDGCEIGFPDMSSPKLDADGCLILKRI